MILVWKNDALVATHEDDQEVADLYPGANMLRTSKPVKFKTVQVQVSRPSIDPVTGEPGQPVITTEEETLFELDEVQDAAFSTETGLTWNGSNWTLSAAAKTKADKRDQRRPASITRAKQMLNIPAVKSIKSLPDAQAFVDGQVSDLDSAKVMLARLTFIVVNLGRHAFARDDEFFPDDE